ncbi:phage holin family protein [Xinfangfangia sp. CPCC 101601]|uniref:Phage holin family protein n=1 Tax=Pseudogemmobacter lacusdianii TaxID=3069608 RepID=A0ABU0VVY6_9RHOB|nr:phage holin family protein [Xinfangfangia sp. CPCC 101601]MDQ2065911.1 phage holin family protein [Xinfangfangia sp. CPCC 101601]
MSTNNGMNPFWQVARIALSARQSFRLRLALLQVETKERGGHAGKGLALVLVGALFALAALVLGIVAMVATLVAYHWSLHAALGLTAGGALLLALGFILWGKQALGRAFSSRR